jgi:hypothetical protein
MPAKAAQVFGPVTVDPGFTTTGEKTLLTMNTTLAAGGKNVIIVAYMFADVSATAWANGTFRIKKGATILYETLIPNEHLGPNTYQPKLLIAVDDLPGGNDTYTFTINIVGASDVTTIVHVQGLVIKSDDAVWARNTALVSVPANSTATILSLSTNFPANSKVVVIAFATGTWSLISGAQTLIGAGDVRLKLGTTIVSSNEFSMGSYGVYADVIFPLNVQLSYFTSVTTATQSWSLEINNPTGSAWSFYAGMVAFTVVGGAFLDTSSVALTNGVQVTVGNLSTTLTGDVVVIGLGAAENPTTTSTTFNAGDVVLQLNGSAVGQVALGVSWLIRDTSRYDRAGVMPLFRIDTNVTNPSYQIKMTARAAGINGEAKILAFSLVVVVTVSVDDGGVGVDSVSVSSSIPVLEVGTGVETANLTGSIPASDVGGGVETINLSAVIPVGDIGTGAEFMTSGIFQPVGDTGSGLDEVVMLLKEVLDIVVGTELVDMVKGVFDTGIGTDVVNSPQFNPLVDTGLGVDTPMITVPQFDAGTGADTTDMLKEVLDMGVSIDEIPFLSKEALDTSSGIDVASLVTSVMSHDFAVGTDVVGLVSVIQVVDTGVGAELAETQLSIYGLVTLDNNVVVGVHSIPYRDLARDGLPIQTQRRFVDDKVYVGGVEVGVVTVEWEDKVSDVVPGQRVLRVLGVVRLVD